VLEFKRGKVRFVLGPDMDEAETLAMIAEAAAQALGDGDLAKALRNPLPQIDRARARRAFLKLQRDFEKWITAELLGADDLYTHLRDLTERAGVAAEYIRPIIERQHRVIRARMNPAMRAFYLRAFELGLRAGGAGRGMLDNEERLVERVRRNEYAYLDNFIADLRHREGQMPYKQRAQLYANALQEVYWMGYVYADLSPDRYVRWVSHGDEPCADCAYMSGNKERLVELGFDPDQLEDKMGFPPGGRWGNGVYSAQELARLGIFPQSGALACTTNCHCKLVAAQRPKWSPQGKAASGRFRSLQPKEFTGTVRDRKTGVLVVTRAHAHEARKRYAERARRTETRYHPRRGRAR